MNYVNFCDLSQNFYLFPLKYWILSLHYIKSTRLADAFLQIALQTSVQQETLK